MYKYICPQTCVSSFPGLISVHTQRHTYSLTSWGEGASLALVGDPSSDCLMG